jgi:hypothetical protein
MKGKLILAALVPLLVGGRAEAANIAVIATPPGFLALVIFAGACACIALAIKIQSVIKGGLLSKGWMFFVVGFAVLALTQVASLLRSMDVLMFPEWVVPTLFVLMAALFFYGVLSTKRVLE